MSQPKSRIIQWRERLRSEDVENHIPDSSIDELIRVATQQVDFYFRTPKQLGPTALARELDQYAKGLGRAAKALKLMGREGLLRVHAASRANGEFDVEDYVHTAKLLPMSNWAKRAATLARKEKPSARDEKSTYGRSKRGRTSDLNLLGLVTVLAHQYASLLSLRPTYTVDPDTGAGHSRFNMFVKAAVTDFAPKTVAISLRQIDRATLEALRSAKRLSTFPRATRPANKNRETRF